jgi:hypothetical protein
MSTAPAHTATLAVDSRCTHGEGVVWCERRQVLFWVDIAGRQLWRHAPASGASRHWTLPDRPGCLGLFDDGRLLLASNRGHDSIAVVPLDANGTLGAPVLSPCVAEPRDFIICGDYVLEASQRDSVIRAYRLNFETLRLEDAGFGLEIGRPVCLCPLQQ